MPFFRKKPVVIEAHQFTASSVTQEKIAAWCGGAVKGTALPEHERVIHIQTIDGEMEGKIGDWILKGVRGEFYPCKPDIFRATYDYTGENHEH